MSWRDIPCRTVDWAGQAQKLYGSRRNGNAISRICRKEGEWYDLTLGDVANLGVRRWERMSGIGEKGSALIAAVIDAAAEGEDVGGKAADAYVPKCERGA